MKWFMFFGVLLLVLGAWCEPVEQVVVVFKTHFDIGFTEPVEEVVNRYRTEMIDHAMDTIDASGPDAKFSWTLPGWPMAQILYPEQDARRRQRVLDFVRSGRLVVHALPFTIQTEHLDLEELVRGFRFSSDLARATGQPLPRDAKMTDVPGHSWILPTLLKNAGVDFLHIGCNSASTSPDVPPLFWWEGPDGSRVLTMYTAEGYGTDLVPPKDWPYKTWLALIHSGDNQGPPDAEQIKALRERAAKELSGSKLVFGRLSDFADAVVAEGANIPVVRGDMADTWIHGIMSMPIQTAMARNARAQTAGAESLNTLLNLWGVPQPSVKEAIAKVYESSLLYGEHTWGSSVSPFGYRYGKEWEECYETGHYTDMETTFEDHGGYALDARAVANIALDNMQALCKAVNVEGRRLVVFNPLPWRRDALAAAEVPDVYFSALRDDAGNVLPVQRSSWQERFLARDLPPMGYRTYVPIADAPADDGAARADAENGVLENNYLKVLVDEARGTIRSIVDKATGKELVDADSEYGFGQYLYEQYDADDCEKYMASYCKIRPDWAGAFAKPQLPPASVKQHSVASPRQFDSRYFAGPVSATVVMTAKESADIPHGTALHVTLYRDCPYLDVELAVTAKKQDPWPEAGWLCLPFAVPDAAYRLGRVGAPVDPAKDIIRNSNFDMFCLSTGMTMTGSDGITAGFCPMDSPLVSIGYRGLYRFSGAWTPREPVAFVNLFNNAWGCNYQQWIGGTWSSRVRVWACKAADADQTTLTRSWDARTPLQAAYYEGPAGSLPPSRAGLELDRPGVLVTAFGPNPDGDGTTLRLWEQAGIAGPCKVTLPEGLGADAKLCDLRGRPLDKKPLVEGAVVTVDMRAYGPTEISWITASF